MIRLIISNHPEKIMIKALALVLFLILCPTVGNAAGEFTVVSNNFPPFSYNNPDGQHVGIDYEIMKAILDRMDVKFKLILLPWKRALLTVRKNGADAVLDITKDATRQKYMTFPEEPISIVPIVLFHMKKRKIQYTGVDSLKGKTIGLMNGYTYGGFFDDKKFIKLDRVSNLEHNFLKLVAGRLDLVAAYREVGISTLRKMGLTDQIEFCKKPIDMVPMFLAFTKSKVSKEFVLEFSQKLKAFKEAGLDRQIKIKYNFDY